jgi:hypothetical protein
MLRLPGKWHSAARGAAVAGATLMALAMTGAAPAMAASGDLSAPAIAANAAAAAQAQPIHTWPGLGLQDAQTSRCLDSNTAGAAYTNPCQWPGNHYQDWTMTEWEAIAPTGVPYDFFSFQDDATGRCLDSNAAGALYTAIPTRSGTAPGEVRCRCLTVRLSYAWTVTLPGGPTPMPATAATTRIGTSWADLRPTAGRRHLGAEHSGGTR